MAELVILKSRDTSITPRSLYIHTFSTSGIIMDSKDINTINDIFHDLNDKALGAGIQKVRSFIDTHPYLMYDEDLENIEHDYRLMLDYMKRGFNDPQRNAIYENLLIRLHAFTSNLCLAYKIKNIPFYKDASLKSENESFSHERIKTILENFVTDTAMLSLEDENTKEGKSRNIYKDHNSFMQSLFCYIVVSRQWTDNDRVFFENLLLSPIIDNNDTLLIISAIMLAAMNNADTQKFATLLNIYIKSSKEKVRQRALIGWIFSLSSSNRIEEKMASQIENVLSDAKIRSEITDLQKQMIFCLNAEKDNDKIQHDIMPDLIKNNNINITRFGITEKEEDPMSDVFDPGASDREMEKMEASFQKMMDMQKSGSDIYFGGFSQMKRFPFFYSLSNWFCPFYIDNPEISSAKDKLKGTSLLANILENGPFCDSDKYSFAFAISTVINHLPANMKEMLNSDEILGPVKTTDEDKENPAYIRRMILQDLYRFFRLFPQKEQIRNPFNENNGIFVTDSLLKDKLKDSLADLGFSLIKHKNTKALDVLMRSYDDTDTPNSLMLHGMYFLNIAKKPEEATGYLRKLCEIRPDNRRAKSLLARAYFEGKNYLKASECYGELHYFEPDNTNIALNYCVAMSKAKQYDQSVNLLYKLNLELPSSASVTRVLAWTLMGCNKLEQAWNEYNKLLTGNDAETGDWLNAGYCQWFMGNTGKAAEMFAKFMKKKQGAEDYSGSQSSIYKEFCNDYDVLKEHGITITDMRIMSDLACF